MYIVDVVSKRKKRIQIGGNQFDAHVSQRHWDKKVLEFKSVPIRLNRDGPPPLSSLITLQCITLHHITLHQVTLHYITLNRDGLPPLSSLITLRYITLHHISLH